MDWGRTTEHIIDYKPVGHRIIAQEDTGKTPSETEEASQLALKMMAMTITAPRRNL
jgi:hypothetical protein